MDALALLANVSRTYRDLDGLALEARIITESGDDDAGSRNHTRCIFKYARPDRFRYEPVGAQRMVQVSDGRNIHTCFSRRHGGQGPRCHSVPLSPTFPFPHRFRPDRPGGSGNEPFLYEELNEEIVSAEVIREEEGCPVVAVTYGTPSRFPLVPVRMPVLFRIDPENFLVRAFRQEVGHRMPAEEEITWNTHSISVEKIEINPSFPADIFEFVPPAETVVSTGPRGRMSFGGGGGGFASAGDDDSQRVEHRGSHEWEGETLVEHSKWKLKGTTLLFERRLTFPESGDELQIVERAESPAGKAETSSSLRLK